jgi:hypothetical protein
MRWMFRKMRRLRLYHQFVTIRVGSRRALRHDLNAHLGGLKPAEQRNELCYLRLPGW